MLEYGEAESQQAPDAEWTSETWERLTRFFQILMEWEAALGPTVAPEHSRRQDEDERFDTSDDTGSRVVRPGVF